MIKTNTVNPNENVQIKDYFTSSQNHLDRENQIKHVKSRALLQTPKLTRTYQKTATRQQAVLKATNTPRKIKRKRRSRSITPTLENLNHLPDQSLKSNIPRHPEPSNIVSTPLAPNITSNPTCRTLINSERRGLIIEDTDVEEFIETKSKRRRFVIEDTDGYEPVNAPKILSLPDKENCSSTHTILTIDLSHFDDAMDEDYVQPIAKWNTKTAKEDFEDNGGKLFCSYWDCNCLVNGDEFDLKNHLTGESYAKCKVCRSKDLRPAAQKVDPQAKMRKMCHKPIESDKAMTKGAVVSKIDEVFPIVEKLWDDHDGECCYCKRTGLVCLAESGDLMASLERSNSRLPHFHPDQTLMFICVMCNWAKKEVTQRNFFLFLGKIRSNANTPYRHIIITTEDEKRIKKMRGSNYASEESKWRKLKCVEGGLCKIVGELATGAEMVAIARKAGKMCELTKIECVWTKESNMLKLGFNRLKNIEGTRMKPTIKYSHSKDNIAVRMSILNRAQNQFGEESLVDWVKSIQEKYVAGSVKDM